VKNPFLNEDGTLNFHVKVRFRGETYWLHHDVLAPLDHYSEDGDLLANPFRDISYAIIVLRSPLLSDQIVDYTQCMCSRN
jgi:hypothetical protein